MRKKKKIIILIIVLAVVLFVLIGINSYLKNYDSAEKAQEKYGYQTMPVYKGAIENNESEKTIKYTNIEALQNLKGEFPTSTVIKKIKAVFVDEIPTVLEEVKDYNNSKLKEYYTKNAKDIKIKLLIVNEEDFINMVKKFSELKSDIKKDYSSCEFVVGNPLSFKFSYENAETIECKIIGDNSNTITFEF